MTPPRAPAAQSIAVVIEATRKRAFASALDWPGWVRSGRDEAAALEALAAYAPRYAPVARGRRPAFPGRVTSDSFKVVERVAGDATTDFGAPGTPAKAEQDAPTPAEARRLAALVQGASAVLDAVAASAPAELRKGPRGGGRDRDHVVQHVIGAEVAYARKLGARRLSEPALADRSAVEHLRAVILEALTAPVAPDTASWSVRYAARRIAWHILDHAWEIEDRSDGQPRAS